MFNTIIDKFLSSYEDKDLFTQKKADYTLRFFLIVVLYSVVVFFISFFLLSSQRQMDLVSLIIWLLVSAQILACIYKGKLIAATNVFIFSGLLKGVLLLQTPIGLHFFVHVALIGFISTAIHSKKYQLYISHGTCYVLIVLYSLLPIKGHVHGSIEDIIAFRISTSIGMFMYFASLLYLSNIINRQINKTIQLDLLSKTDPLTGIYNRVQYAADLESLSTDLSYYILILDLDHFKAINDTYGHSTGDDILIQFTAKIKNLVGHIGSVYRLGGEEFFILLPGLDAHQGELVGKKINMVIKETYFAINKKVTVSIGGIHIRSPWQKKDLNLYLKYVDDALYYAKSTGRDQVIDYYKHNLDSR